MSPATQAAPLEAAGTDRPADDWLSLAEAARVSGLHQTTILRISLAGDIRHRVRGRRTLFHGGDVRRHAV